MKLANQDRGIIDVLHLETERSERSSCPAMSQGDAMTYNRMEAKPIAGAHCRFCGDPSVP
jgi:hypothetical protein